MELRPATPNDLPQLKAVFTKLISHMNQNKVPIWDDIYPCEFFAEDIKNNRLYILTENKQIVSAFALCDSSSGSESVVWKGKNAKALYIDRFGVNTEYLRKGIGSLTLQKAIVQARELGADYLRLFVVDINIPAINLYVKNGFEKAAGAYDEIIDDDLILHELGFEIKTAD